MNKSFFRNALRLLTLVGVLGTLTLAAQVPDVAGVNSAMIKLFGDKLTFTAGADVHVYTSNRVEWLTMASLFTGADTKLRVEVDLGQIRSSAVNAATINTFKQMGMDRVVSIIRPDKKAIYIIYPKAGSYANMPLSDEDAKIANQKLEKTPIGHETMDGHPCVKNRTIVRSAKGVPLIQATTWNATDLKDFPIRIETTENGNTTVMHFQQINLAVPEAKVFEPPAGFKQYSNPQDLLTAAYKKANGSAKK